MEFGGCDPWKLLCSEVVSSLELSIMVERMKEKKERGIQSNQLRRGCVSQIHEIGYKAKSFN